MKRFRSENAFACLVQYFWKVDMNLPNLVPKPTSPLIVALNCFFFYDLASLIYKSSICTKDDAVNVGK